MSLAFLAKKSWHTANLKNVEKVWIAEQKHDAEEKKLAELRKNIEEERQLQELRQLQAANGNKTAALERVDWLYEGPMAQSGPSTEEYLLGKEFKPSADSSDLKQLETTKYGSLALTKTTALPASDAFSRLNEDPMMLIRKRQQAAHERVLKNPVKMNAIQARVDAIRSEKTREKHDKKALKKAKKALKKEKKAKHKRRSSSYDDLEKDERRRSPVQHHRRSRSAERRDDRRSRSRSRPRASRIADRSLRSRYSRSRSYDRRSRSTSRSSSPRRQRRQRSHAATHRPSTAVADRRNASNYRDYSPADRTARDRSPSLKRASRSEHARTSRDDADDRSRSRYRHRSDRDRSTSPRHSRHHVSDRPRDRQSHDRPIASSRMRSPVRRSSRSPSPPPRATKSDRKKPLDESGKYGLVSHDNAIACKDVDTSSLGPNAKFLDVAREKRRREDDERNAKLAKRSTRGSEQFTDAQKRQMAAQMVADAKQRDAMLAKRALQATGERNNDDAMRTGNPHFLKAMQDAAYMGDSSGDMSDRLRRNKHYIQRNADAKNFLAK